MGHFFFPCRLSNTPIYEGDECYIFPTQKADNSDWFFSSLPSIVKLDEYGHIVKVVEKNGELPEDDIWNFNCILIKRRVLDKCVKTQNECYSIYEPGGYQNLYVECEKSLIDIQNRINSFAEKNPGMDLIELESTFLLSCKHLSYINFGHRIKFRPGRDFALEYSKYDSKTREFFWTVVYPTLSIIKSLHINIDPYRPEDTLQESWSYEFAPVITTLNAEVDKIISESNNL